MRQSLLEKAYESKQHQKTVAQRICGAVDGRREDGESCWSGQENGLSASGTFLCSIHMHLFVYLIARLHFVIVKYHELMERNKCHRDPLHKCL